MDWPHFTKSHLQKEHWLPSNMQYWHLNSYLFHHPWPKHLFHWGQILWLWLLLKTLSVILWLCFKHLEWMLDLNIRFYCIFWRISACWFHNNPLVLRNHDTQNDIRFQINNQRSIFDQIKQTYRLNIVQPHKFRVQITSLLLECKSKHNHTEGRRLDSSELNLQFHLEVEC